MQRIKLIRTVGLDVHFLGELIAIVQSSFDDRGDIHLGDPNCRTGLKLYKSQKSNYILSIQNDKKRPGGFMDSINIVNAYPSLTSLYDGVKMTKIMKTLFERANLSTVQHVD